MVLLTKKKAKLVKTVIDEWQLAQVISSHEADKLKSNIKITSFRWKELAKYSFWAAIICMIISVTAIMTDNYIMRLINQIFYSPDSVKMIFFIAVSILMYYLGFKRKIHAPARVYLNEAIIMFGVLATAVAILFFGKLIDTGSGHFSLLFLLASFVYAGIAIFAESKLIMVFAILSLGSWLGAETGYMSGWGAYYLGMNYPLRFLIFGVALTGVSHTLLLSHKYKMFFQPVFVLGLLYLFVSLWILSIFGNYISIYSWYDVKQIELLHWSLLFGLFSFAAIFYGLKFDSSTARGFGITFLFINLYTRYFEYFWDYSHKAIFFGILGISLWYLGSKAEKIWCLGKS